MDKFHKHLDDCEQCANHPFNLCQLGAQLLIDATITDDKEVVSNG